MAVGLVVGGCVASRDQTTLGPGGTSSATTDPTGEPTPGPDLNGANLDAFYAQDIVWEPCDGDFECATVQAPLDWDAPETAAIGVALERSVATGDEDKQVGSLLINPGGPGGSGIELLEPLVSSVLGPDVLDAYDVVGFDPRGVGRSSAVDCGGDAQLDAFFLTDYPLENQADVEALRETERAFGAACLEATGPLLGEVDTISAARDMDLIRAVLGDDQLYYLGFSYGTFLGATYAELYPENVGRLVLDGAIDPSVSNDDQLIGQAVGFENALRAYVTDCMEGSDCPLTGDVDSGLAQIAEITQGAEDSPIDAGGGNKLNGTLAFFGLVYPLYSTDSWSYLTMALDEVINSGTASILYQLANAYLQRDDDGHWANNMMVASPAINCVDYPSAVRDFDQIEAFASQVEAVSPTFGRDMGMSIGCDGWPFPATSEPHRITAPGAAPILVVGTTGDPATPYQMAVSLADQLESGVLLTWEGEGHTAYGRGSSCVDDIVEAYLVDGDVPDDTTC